MKKIAVLWDERYLSENVEEDGSPFYDKKIKDAIEFMAEKGRERDLEIYVAHYSQYENGGLKKFWYFNETWKTGEDVEMDLVYDKFYFNEETKKLKRKIDKDVGLFNKPEFEEFCKDKFRVYEIFPDCMPITFKASDLGEALKEIETEKVVMKPRFGSGGEDVEVVDRGEVEETLSKFKEKNLEEDDVVVQEFKDSSLGIPFLDVEGVHDLRVVVVDGNLSYSSIRTPKEGYISNVSRGGDMEILEAGELPEEIVEAVSKIDRELERYGKRIYSADFMYDENERPWLIELNSKPGVKFGERQVTERKKRFIEDVLEILKD